MPDFTALRNIHSSDDPNSLAQEIFTQLKAYLDIDFLILLSIYSKTLIITALF